MRGARTTDAGMAILGLAHERWVADQEADYDRLLSDGVGNLLAVLEAVGGSAARTDTGASCR
jgi:hypothetical protein